MKFFLLWVGLSVAMADVIYVKADANGAKNGQSWANAYNDLSDAFEESVPGDEIWLAEGVYTPTYQVSLFADHPNDLRNKSFVVPAGVSIYGGFQGIENSKDDRFGSASETILSADIQRDGIGENNARVLLIVDNAPPFSNLLSIIDSITLKDAYNEISSGGGLFAGSINPPFITAKLSMSNVIMKNNVAVNGGAASLSFIYLDIDNCLFVNNHAFQDGGALNLNLLQGTNRYISNSTFASNTAEGSGGAINRFGGNADYSHIGVINSVFNNNHALIEGGAIKYQARGADHSMNGSLERYFFLINSIFTFNTAQYGGAMSIGRGRPVGGSLGGIKGSNVLASHITMFGNYAFEKGGAFHIQTLPSTPSNLQYDGELIVVNSIIWNNNSRTEDINGPATINFSLLQGPNDYGLMNSDLDPAFVNPHLGDFRLKPNSPAINAGLPLPLTNLALITNLELIDISGKMRDNFPDLGAYEAGAGPDISSLRSR